MIYTLANKTTLGLFDLAEKRDRALAKLNRHLLDGPNLSSNEGIDDAIWKIAVIALVAILAAGVLTTIFTKIKGAGDRAATKLDTVPGFKEE